MSMNGDKIMILKESNQQNEAKSQLERRSNAKHMKETLSRVQCQLMMQSIYFKEMWQNLKLAAEQQNDEFTFALNEITGICFGKIVEWMEKHKGQPEPVVKTNRNSSERIWFNLTPWERQFFDVDFETLKEYFVAASFLKLESLFIYCAQECARVILDKEPEEVREMLCLPAENEISEEDLALTREVLENCHLIDWPATENGQKKTSMKKVMPKIE